MTDKGLHSTFLYPIPFETKELTPSSILIPHKYINFKRWFGLKIERPACYIHLPVLSATFIGFHARFQ